MPLRDLDWYLERLGTERENEANKLAGKIPIDKAP
jgi:hypothetical protein